MQLSAIMSFSDQPGGSENDGGKHATLFIEKGGPSADRPSGPSAAPAIINLEQAFEEHQKNVEDSIEDDDHHPPIEFGDPEKSDCSLCQMALASPCREQFIKYADCMNNSGAHTLGDQRKNCEEGFGRFFTCFAEYAKSLDTDTMEEQPEQQGSLGASSHSSTNNQDQNTDIVDSNSDATSTRN